MSDNHIGPTPLKWKSIELSATQRAIIQLAVQAWFEVMPSNDVKELVEILKREAEIKVVVRDDDEPESLKVAKEILTPEGSS